VPIQNLALALAKAVSLATGGRANKAHPGQAELATDVMRAMEGRGRLSAEAPTGSGKSLAVLVSAMLGATTGERTVVSTGTLGLQDQTAQRDGPAASQTVVEVTG
jgi:Rad3-related DNA helicase